MTLRLGRLRFKRLLDWLAHAVTAGNKENLELLKEDILSINPDKRLLRGGSFDVPASLKRSAFRIGVVPTYRSDGNVGLLPARTLTP